MFQVYQLSDDGYEMSLGYYPTEEEADVAAEEWGERRPHAYVDVREV